MPAASLTKTKKAIGDGVIQPVYYLTGEEDVLKDEFIDHILEHGVDAGSRDFNFDVRSAGDLDGESLNNLVETPPMLAERRIAVVRNIEQWRKNSKAWKTLHAYLEKPSPTTTLILVHGAGQDLDQKVASNATHIDAAFSDPSDLNEWATTRAAAVNVTLEPDALTHLLAATDHNLSAVASELSKLSAVATERPLTVDEVGLHVGVRRGETPADWLNAALNRKAAKAVDLLRVILEQPGVTGVRLVMNLGTALIGTRIARAILDGGETAARAKSKVIDLLRTKRIWVGSYAEESARWVRAAEKWTAEELDTAIASAYRADQELKSTTLTDQQGTIETMLLSFVASGVR
jgi:DNA polymerase III delta subunit